MSDNEGAEAATTPLVVRMKRWARRIRQDVVALWLAVRDPRVPWPAKALAALVAAYALSPVDLIPDFIPVIGYLDDLLLVPLGILIAVRLIPAAIMQDLREQARDRERPTSRTGLVIVVIIWLVAAGLMARWIWSVL